ncbi:hypothetical protein GQ457_01G018530 [Hibiscus cannabinus]
MCLRNHSGEIVHSIVHSRFMVNWCIQTVVWNLLVDGSLKFNVDGSAKGQPGSAGGGDVLRDAEGCILVLFSGPLGLLGSNMAEL